MTATLSPLHWKETEPPVFRESLFTKPTFLGAPDRGTGTRLNLNVPAGYASRATAPKPAWEVS